MSGVGNMLELEVIQPEHYDDVIKHLRSNFFSDETLNSSMDLCKPGEAHELLEKHSLDTLRDNVSIMAYDKNKQIAGVLLNGILHKGDIQIAVDKLLNYTDEKFNTIFKFLYEQNAKVDLFAEYDVDKIFELRILSVDSNYRGVGLAKRLLSRSITEAANQNFKILKMDATGLFSQKVAASHGFKPVLETFYEDYLDENGEQVFKVPAPHTSLQILCKDLSKMEDES